ncbi:DUF305 domain-containing protein [Massilia varians]|uniref:DUF305 domain-containing protein n=1 Tax=Massilia varians TaxID=457921 RepID=UPI0025562AD7|nr:DUF305 domain-containing protein [Massilia varians]MDK6079951.1 DUF305 domain-containing protein [Massilia varians]
MNNISANTGRTGRVRRSRWIRTAVAATTASSLLLSSSASAEGPGDRRTARFEKNYLTFIIDHHYSALRMTELAAGSDRVRDPAVVNPDEGTTPTPGYAESIPKAAAEEIRSMSRQANRGQREEIAKAQRMLREWYGVTHVPRLAPSGMQMIQMLERAPAGRQFDEQFLKVFSSHHFAALSPSIECQVKSDLSHDGLRRYCDNIVTMQKNSINDMREMLCKQFRDCDFVPVANVRRLD